MTDSELREVMKEMCFTDKGIDSCLEIKNEYPNLYKFYDEYMGNFGFTKSELLIYAEDIQRYIENHSEYVLLYSDGYEEDENGRNMVWWLTSEY